jgi:hypothetical protein
LSIHHSYTHILISSFYWLFFHCPFNIFCYISVTYNIHPHNLPHVFNHKFLSLIQFYYAIFDTINLSFFQGTNSHVDHAMFKASAIIKNVLLMLQHSFLFCWDVQIIFLTLIYFLHFENFLDFNYDFSVISVIYVNLRHLMKLRSTIIFILYRHYVLHYFCTSNSH